MIFDPGLCRKYTDLSEKEIAVLASYEDKLQSLADEQEADVFIDCRTRSGKSAIVVAEAKPRTVRSNYRMVILGMIIRWENEPAVDRTFRIGLPTIGMTSEQSPEDQTVIQSVFPIFCGDRLIATLIYEKKNPYLKQEKKETAEAEGEKASEAGTEKPAEKNASGAAPSLQQEYAAANVNDLFNCIYDAVMLTDQSGKIRIYNRNAAELMKQLGYVETPDEMDIDNLWDSQYVVQSASQTEIIRVRDHVLEGKWTKTTVQGMDRIYTVRDITERIHWQTEYQKQVIATRELRHRIKNSLLLLTSIFEQKAKQKKSQDAKAAYEEANIRINSVLVTLNELGTEENGRIPLKDVLLQLCQDIGYTFSFKHIELTGDDLFIPGKLAGVISLIVSELIYNSLKYAWEDRSRGHIKVEISHGFLTNVIAVEDDGCGIRQNRAEGEPENDGTDAGGSVGTDLIRTLVTDRLKGDIRVITGEKGTRTEIEFLD